MTQPDETIVPISAIEHHEYCPRQCALIFVDGLWEDNPHTIAGSRAHRRVDSGVTRRERDRLVLRAIPLWSESLGLSGRADAAEIERDGHVAPVEYKNGIRHGRTADLQLCAEALCLEEMLKVDIPQGYIWYGAWRRRWPVAIDQELRRSTVSAIVAIRALLVGATLPAAPAHERCRACQLEPQCLPDVVTAPKLAPADRPGNAARSASARRPPCLPAFRLGGVDGCTHRLRHRRRGRRRGKAPPPRRRRLSHLRTTHAVQRFRVPRQPDQIATTHRRA